MSAGNSKKTARVPPRWFVLVAWYAHRGLYRATGGRLGLWRPKEGGWGTMRLTTTGRRSGEARSVILGYYEDGPNLVTMAMNGWAPGEPSWWLNLQANPIAFVDLSGDRRSVKGRAAEGEERARPFEVGGPRTTRSTNRLTDRFRQGSGQDPGCRCSLRSCIRLSP